MSTSIALSDAWNYHKAPTSSHTIPIFIIPSCISAATTFSSKCKKPHQLALMYSLTMPFVDPMFHCTRLQHTLLHHTIPFYTSFIFVYITTAPSSRNSSLHHLTSGCSRDLLSMSYSVALYFTMLYYTNAKQVFASVLAYYYKF